MFGPKRALLSMTTEGAMQGDETLLSLTLALVMEPDAAGRTVVFLDRIRAVPEVAPRDALLRVVFFVMHQAALQEATQKRGFVLLANMRVRNAFDARTDYLL